MAHSDCRFLLTYFGLTGAHYYKPNANQQHPHNSKQTVHCTGFTDPLPR